MPNLSLSRWTPVDVAEMRDHITQHSESSPNIATHLERELWGDVLRFIERYSHDKNSRDMAAEAMKTIFIAFKRQMG